MLHVVFPDGAGHLPGDYLLIVKQMKQLVRFSCELTHLNTSFCSLKHGNIHAGRILIVPLLNQRREVDQAESFLLLFFTIFEVLYFDIDMTETNR